MCYADRFKWNDNLLKNLLTCLIVIIGLIILSDDELIIDN
jgi:hypothetical protein